MPKPDIKTTTEHYELSKKQIVTLLEMASRDEINADIHIGIDGHLAVVMITTTEKPIEEILG